MRKIKDSICNDTIFLLVMYKISFVDKARESGIVYSPFVVANCDFKPF